MARGDNLQDHLKSWKDDGWSFRERGMEKNHDGSISIIYAMTHRTYQDGYGRHAAMRVRVRELDGQYERVVNYDMWNEVQMVERGYNLSNFYGWQDWTTSDSTGGGFYGSGSSDATDSTGGYRYRW